jgi:hypothetical protein
VHTSRLRQTGAQAESDPHGPPTRCHGRKAAVPTSPETDPKGHRSIRDAPPPMRRIRGFYLVHP